MIWGDKKLKRVIYKAGRIEHGREELINPASINLRLGNTFAVPLQMMEGIRLGDHVKYNHHSVNDGDYFPLKPGQFCLGTTKEYIYVPDNAAAFVQGRSSIGRIGLTVQNAGFVDPGFFGAITLELVNESPSTIYLVPGYPLVQLVFFDCTRVKNPYDGKYNGQVRATGSRMNQDKNKYSDLGLKFDSGRV